MTTLAEGPAPRSDPVALHDRLEEAYFALARTSSRWFEQRSPDALMGGFAGLDSSTMNRVALVDAPDSRGLARLLGEAALFFGERQVPWSVQLTPHSRPVGAEQYLESRGFALALELSVMTWARGRDLPRARSVAEVREATPEEIGRFTSLTVEAFRMPARFYPALLDVNAAWVNAGARAFFACVNGEPVGTALLAPLDGVWGIYNVGTLRAWRKRGIATLLMRTLLEEFAASDAEHLTLQVARGSPAEGLYARMGFETRYPWRLFTR